MPIMHTDVLGFFREKKTNITSFFSKRPQEHGISSLDIQPDVVQQFLARHLPKTLGQLQKKAYL